MKLLLDTNVLLDYCFVTRIPHEEVFEFFNVACANANDLYASTTSANNFFYIANTEIKMTDQVKKPALINEMTWSFYDNVSSLVTFIGCDESDIFIAEKMRSKHNDLEDNLIIASCVRSKADYLITNDKDLIRKQIVPTKSPKEMTKLIGENNE